MPAGRIPPEADARAGLYRSLLAGRRMLIVLDNARDEQQVRPLLPASPASLVIITSRNQLGGLAAADRARLLTLDVLSHDEAVHMLTARVGAARAAAEPGAVGEIAALCGRLPLALAVAAARAEARPDFPLAALAAELQDRAGRLDALDAGDPAASVRAVFSWSYRQLSAAAARMFRLLGLHPGPDISPAAAASLAAVRRARGAPPAGRAHPRAPGRPSTSRAGMRCTTCCAPTPPIRPATPTASPSAPPPSAGCWTTTCTPPATAPPWCTRPSGRSRCPRPAPVPHPSSSPGTTRPWPGSRPNTTSCSPPLTLAVDWGLDNHGWQISWAMHPFLATQGHNLEWSAIKRMTMAAAVRDDAAIVASGARDIVGTLGDYQWVPEYYANSLKLYQQLGNRRGEALCLYGLAVLAEYQGQYAEALAYAEQAVGLCRGIGDKAGETEMLNAAGWYHALMGDYPQARGLCRQALALNTRLRQPPPGGRYLEQPGLHRIPCRRLRRGGRLL